MALTSALKQSEGKDQTMWPCIQRASRALRRTGLARTGLGLCLAALAGFGALTAAPQAAEAKYAAIIMDGDTGEVLYARNADTRNHPASLTKMMTLYLTFEALRTKKLKLNQVLTASHRAGEQPPSRIGLLRGDKITVEQAILALVTKSANDVAVVLAETLGGSQRAFARKMTAKARQLGMKRTTFRNPSGLHNRAQLSTARDMAKLSRALLRDYPRQYRYFSTKSFRFKGNTFKNHNKLLGNYEGTDGIKTGYISAAGFNLAASVKRNGKRLIGVVFGGKSSKWRDRHMVALMNKGYTTLAKRTGKSYAPVAERRKQGKASVSTAAVRSPSNGAIRPAPSARGKTSWEGRYAIQVGAYARMEQARQQARKSKNLLGPKLKTFGQVAVQPIRTKRGQLYRSRLIGLTKWRAKSSCKLLKKKGTDCLVVRLDDNPNLAER